MSHPRIRQLLDHYRTARDRDHTRGGSSVTRLLAVMIADHLLTLDDDDDLRQRDATNPACPPIDAARRPHDPREGIKE